jgi:transposase
VACEVVAPTLVPRGAADRVKTDRRDCVRLVLSYRAGLLTAIRVPSEQEEAVRDLVRTRADLVDDRRRMMQRVGALLQRHGRVWRAPRWTGEHRAWLDRQSFTEPALQAALRTYLAALDAREPSWPCWKASCGAAGPAWTRWPRWCGGWPATAGSPS